ncbi:MAG: WD40 repeat domain-containing protein [Rhizobiaceae bacterium]
MAHEASINSVVFDQGGEKAATTSDDYTVRLWAVGDEPGKVVARKRYPGSESSAFSPDGRLLMTEGAEFNDRQLFTTSDGKPFGRPIPVGGVTTAVAFSADGERLFVSSRDGGQIWNVLSQDPIGKQIAAGWVDHAAFTSDGKLLTVSIEGAPRFWDASTGEPVGQPLTFLGIPRAASLSPDEKFVVAASRNTTARIWNLSTKAPVGAVLRHDARIWSAVFSPDGRFVLTASDDKTARLWDAHTGRPAGDPLRHDSEVKHATFSHDGSLVLTASEDGTVQVWDTASSMAVGRARYAGKSVGSAIFSTDDQNVLAISATAAIVLPFAETDRLRSLTYGCTSIGEQHDLVVLEQKYGIERLEPICGSNPPFSVQLDSLR